MTPPRARRIASRVLWAALHGYEGHHLTERQRLGAWRRAMRGVVRGPSNARQMETTGAAMTLPAITYTPDTGLCLDGEPIDPAESRVAQ